MKKLYILLLSIITEESLFPIFNIKAYNTNTEIKSPVKDIIHLSGENNETARLLYNHEGETLDYILHAQNLIPTRVYTLVYYPQDQYNIQCLGTQRADKNGKLHLKNSVDIPSIPFEDIYVQSVQYSDEEDMIMLIPSYQIFCNENRMDLSYISDYLVSDSMITYSEI